MTKTNEKGKFTGKHMLITILSFFGVIFAMNFTFAYMAFNTFTGLDVDNAYNKGRHFNQQLAAAHKQKDTNWKVDLSYKLNGSDKIFVSVNTKDKNGQPLSGLKVRVKLRRPTQAHMDQTAMLAADGIGSYAGLISMPVKGQWDLILLAEQQGREYYKSIKRIVIK